MKPPDDGLWQRIESFSVDEGDASFTFAERLARENRWSVSYANRVIGEYKRFLYLAVTDGPAAPSDEVDQAWHLHLTYSRSYWVELCPKILRRPLHHHPTKGGPAEARKHVEWYERTMANYRREFHSEPPPDIWPSAEQRFGHRAMHCRVNEAEYWTVPKAPIKRIAAGILCSTAVLAVAAGWRPLLSSLGPLDMPGPEFLVMYAVVGVLSLVAAYALRYSLRTPAELDPDAANRLNPIAVACLAHGPHGAINAAIVGLVEAGFLTVNKSSQGKKSHSFALTASDERPIDATDVERSVYDAVRAAPGMRIADVHHTCRFCGTQLEETLREQGFLMSHDAAWIARFVPAILPVLVVLFGLAKIAVGVSRDRPVAFLIMLTLLVAVTGVCFLPPPRRTRRGDKTLSLLKQEKSPLQEAARASPQSLASSDVAMMVALFGVTSLAADPMMDLRTALRQPMKHGGAGGDSGASGAGCGGGCGGGGCGGGGGGCGGGGCGGCSG